MTSSLSLRKYLGSFITVFCIVAGGFSAHAAGGSLLIQNVSPTGAINPGTQVGFYAAASGFIDPAYALTDSFRATGATVGTIDKAGYFSWTPGVYDAGMHTLTVVATDAYSHSATSSVNILVASNSVIVSGISPGPTVAVRRPLTFSASAPGFTAPSYAVYDSYAMSTLSPGNITSAGAFSWIPTASDLGAHALTVEASDMFGHSARTVVNVTVINPSVSVQSLSPGASAGVGSSVSFLASAPSLTNPVYTVSDAFSGTSTVPTSAINSAGVFAWKPAASDLGLHTLTVTATDASGNAASTTVAILITNAPPAAATSAAVSAPAPAASTPNSAAAPSGYRFTTYLGIGSRGTAVVELQKRLAALGFFTGAATGYFGPLTAASVKQFQAAHGLARVGFVGPGTRAALNSN